MQPQRREVRVEMNRKRGVRERERAIAPSEANKARYCLEKRSLRFENVLTFSNSFNVIYVRFVLLLTLFTIIHDRPPQKHVPRLLTVQ